jgi:hypothetical protein
VLRSRGQGKPSPYGICGQGGLPNLLESVSPQHVATPGTIALEPLDAVEATLAVMEQFPLVAIGKIHQLQELHDFFTVLLYHPVLPERVNDIVVEFGNALYQDIADRFLLMDQPVARADLQRIWWIASTNVLWDAPHQSSTSLETL